VHICAPLPETSRAHLRVPHFGAYKLATRMAECPLVSKVFIDFPYPWIAPRISLPSNSQAQHLMTGTPATVPSPSSSSFSTPPTPSTFPSSLLPPVNAHQRVIWLLLTLSRTCVLAVRDSEHPYSCIPFVSLPIFCG
jgi:hypothetical protein